MTPHPIPNVAEEYQKALIEIPLLNQNASCVHNHKRVLSLVERYLGDARRSATYRLLLKNVNGVWVWKRVREHEPLREQRATNVRTNQEAPPWRTWHSWMHTIEHLKGSSRLKLCPRSGAHNEPTVKTLRAASSTGLKRAEFLDRIIGVDTICTLQRLNAEMAKLIVDTAESRTSDLVDSTQRTPMKQSYARRHSQNSKLGSGKLRLRRQAQAQAASSGGPAPSFEHPESIKTAWMWRRHEYGFGRVRGRTDI
ncbi:uncharacterized protein EDB91DRAFT_1081896 [Suillus paluster]|uniref:uncharacterized protein n=1 Tax=Suillus paluster TaxID=48578 RepID=UPI001B85B46D|nr:uncharacterized protein EDB91DRAFT_1081896 [Suillus paluster]KAG1740820.1 hypothetical protein EDB91DRAFT_1081896 [Suillus paluster]